MSFDRDFKWMRRLALLICGANVAVAIGHLVRREWFMAGTAVCWAAGTLMVLWFTGTAQVIRDNVRDVRAILDKLKPETDQEMKKYLEWLEGGE